MGRTWKPDSSRRYPEVANGVSPQFIEFRMAQKFKDGVLRLYLSKISVLRRIGRFSMHIVIIGSTWCSVNLQTSPKKTRRIQGSVNNKLFIFYEIQNRRA